MEAEEILLEVFGVSADAMELGSDSKTESTRHLSALRNLSAVNNYIKYVLSKSPIHRDKKDERVGRIGPHLVRFDISTQHGLFIVSPDRLTLNSQGNFSTMRANTGIYKDKWMYELQLGSKGVMQVGWGTAHCRFSQESGVGDTMNSFAYDGNRIRKWNFTTYKYGEPWLTGDIIGCALDMDEGTIDFYRNGKHLGTAFEKIPMGAGTAYFPTVSLAFTENLTANFGSSPFRYPVPGYNALQMPPKQQSSQATILFKWFAEIIEVFNKTKSIGKEYELLEDESMTICAFLMCLTRAILKHAGPLLVIPYITEAVFVPFMHNLSPPAEIHSARVQSHQQSNDSKLMICLDLLWAFLEDLEIRACLESTVVYLLSAFRHVSLLPEYRDQCKSLILLTNICHHPVTRQHMLQYLLFDRVRFANFVHVKPLDEAGLVDVVADVWWNTNSKDISVEKNKTSYLNACQRIKEAISEIEALQVDLLVTLLDNTDGSAKTPTSRTIFLRKFKRFVQENLISGRTPLPITLCCFHRLLVAFRVLWDIEIGTTPTYVPCRVFYDASINYSGIDRLGGLLSYLNKTFKNELVHLLGPDHEVIVAMEQVPDISTAFAGAASRLADLPAFGRLMNIGPANQGTSMILERLAYFPYTREDRTPLRLGQADPAISLLELLDGIILFYHVAARKQLAKVAGLRDSMIDYINAMASTKARLDDVRKNNDTNTQLIEEELLRTINVFNTKLSVQARHMAWMRAAIYSEEKQEQLAWLLKVVTSTLQSASEEGNMFSFVPDFYLEALTDLCVGIRNHVHPIAPTENVPGYQEVLRDAAEFLCNHFLDHRIVHANSKETLILTLAGFVSNPLTLAILEKVPYRSRVKVVTNLLKPYDNRAWAQSNWVLVRFWQGNGFAFRYKKSPHLSRKIGPKILQQESISQPIKPCPSTVYQEHVKEALLSNPHATKLFLNSLLNQLNWAFSEFIGMVQEIHNVSSRPERVFIESKQLKICATCFDLAITLLRVLEMICTVAPSVFSDPTQSSSENLLSRLCQLLCQVLNRMSSQTSCFQHVVLLEIPDLESVDHFPILAAVVGILLALLDQDMSTFTPETTEVPKTTQAILTEPSFQLSSLHFVLGEAKPKSTKTRNIKTFSFLNYRADVTEEEITKVRELINYLDVCRTFLPDSKVISDDDDTCTICYAYPIAVTFKPCNHQTCRSCIDRHLLNTRECFFCKATIDKVVDLDGVVLHDFTTDVLTKNSTES